ncbi:GAF and ANTAR domain-containing protein [Nakamurella leprariae]|uniref:GAF and ANTAR domain-containing protein n=1 Tax=Nakamurella leprariae TaxID=2803911 RepID=A0A938YDC9_9ACTN|nr:GAF and ANTAR domain-containing protein [Nakamurella leprariae]MBM9465663.1 GAF and ANTAR domain-containing protein [Nakamurella leprariae]
MTGRTPATTALTEPAQTTTTADRRRTSATVQPRVRRPRDAARVMFGTVRRRAAGSGHGASISERLVSWVKGTPTMVDHKRRSSSEQRGRDSHGEDPRQSLAEQLSEVARSLQAEPDLHRTLQGIVDSAVANVDNAQYAGITTVKGRDMATPAFTDELVEQVDRVQYETGQGPCLDAIRTNATLRSENLRHDERWPEFGAKAADLGVRSMLSVQLYVDEHDLGALNLYSWQVGAFGDDDEQVGLLLASPAAIAMVGGAEQQDNLRTALVNRDMIGQAKGILMERHKITASHAFELLRQVSQDTNRKLHEIARRLTETGENPSASAPPPLTGLCRPRVTGPAGVIRGRTESAGQSPT